MQALYDVPAPAKLNLFLHITGRRADGYHLLQSAFMLIDWCDTLHFELRPDGHISREDLNTPLPQDDLIVRAAKALQRATGCPLGAHIGIHKSIPAQAGMGGGSSDAASTLLALNQLWQLHLDRASLSRIGLQLGADVPFFLCGHGAAWVEGIGEHITPLTGAQALPAAQFAVVKPAAGLETPAIFASALLQRDTAPVSIEQFCTAPYQFGRNDLQPVAEQLCPDVKKVVDWLEEQQLHAIMTGSGSAVFARLSHTQPLASHPSAWQSKKCENLMTHPVGSWVSGI
ncbi:MAG: 4-(cytidine 5'-diphospho)-2-C-methyl-D-erythritol kinase [Giesbergeria sp.]|uniref:4-(cytidine 5'-diphospho)-2-C-methyl-D-erythritol kinase n=1 Tax=Giesbergeria sp. TaxID=2818473 RepID=UPI0026074F64|nr:4-(cytidine 5'-diphospho)-2-C-methyl-D-erythritol kinase [Giesbergeria sp.]MDD2610629.1 4-(cytidine 5'-diphospho)-2-C-methyl-D-erythritol kinase [Giesbergeria sp.]